MILRNVITGRDIIGLLKIFWIRMFECWIQSKQNPNRFHDSASDLTLKPEKDSDSMPNIEVLVKSNKE